MKRWIFLFLSLTLFPFSAGFAKTWTLAETIRYAIQNSPTTDSSRRQLLIGQLNESNALSVFFPSVDFTTTDGIQKQSTPGLTDPWSSTLGFTLSEKLYDNGESLTRYDIAKKDLRLRDINNRKIRDKLCLDVANEFYNYSLAKKLWEARKEQLHIVEKQASSVTAQYHQGFKTKRDYLRSKSLVQRSLTDLNAGEASIRQSANVLRHLIGLPPENDASESVFFEALEPQSNPPDFPTKTLRVEKSYDFQMAELQRNINVLNVDLIKRQYWPNLSLNTGAFYTNANYINTPAGYSPSENYGWNALLTLSWNIWDWGIRRRQVEIAEANRQVQDNVSRSTVLDADSGIKDLTLQMGLLQKNLRLYKELLSAEEQSFGFFWADYREGKIQYLDMVTELGHLLDAKISYYTAYFEMMKNLARYHYYEGNLYEKILGQ